MTPTTPRVQSPVLHFKCPPEVHAALQARAKALDRTLAWVAVQALRAYLVEEPK